MKKSKLSGREIFMIVLLAVLIVGVGYYMGFYTPLQNELVSIRNQTADVETQLQANQGRLASMDSMQAELDEILSRPADQITQIAPYDNAKVVMNQLNGILAPSQEYKLTFADPKFGEKGIVRRDVALDFTCEDYAAAKTIITNLANSKWRCLVSNLSMSSENDIHEEPVNVKATLTFFESTVLK